MYRSHSRKEKLSAKTIACTSMLALCVLGFDATCRAQDPDRAVDMIPTASPIKHVIIIVGENRSFDHIFVTYVPKSNSDKC